ncbi:MAG TPA: apolipoprotein N-acyltransferase, partial [Alphaproteobacteria bacterium]|nr:apolipoprotein N-acyltransferase [Alphaproteobacteria bacterium]
GWIPIPTVTGFSGFAPGTGPDTLSLGGAFSVSPLICYEVIFPGAGLRADKPRPDVLLNVTNDGWYGKSAGPYQHFEQARLRAIESGLPLIRSANTGISALVDPMGRVTAHADLLETKTVDALLPRPLPEPTFYSRHGAFVFLFILVCFIATRIGLERHARER